MVKSKVCPLAAQGNRVDTACPAVSSAVVPVCGTKVEALAEAEAAIAARAGKRQLKQ